MPINISGTGTGTTHSFAKTNVNLEENYIYYKNTGGDVIPPALTDGTGFIYTDGIGSIGGLTDNGLVFSKVLNTNRLQFSATSGGSAIDFTSETAGDIVFNTPIVYDTKLNIDASTTTNQAVKYYTAGTPLTGLVSGNTYFLKNVSASSFAGSQSLYTIAGNTHTFTSCGQTGRVGPNKANMDSTYAAATWSSTYIQQGNFQGYQDWTVPVSGIYGFTVAGASGNNGSGAGTVGQGAIVSGRVALTKGEIITIAVGQQGAAGSAAQYGGSGGGTFVVRKTGFQPLFVAGGGSAEPNTGTGRNGVLTELGGRPTTTTITAGGAAGFGGVSTSGFSGAGGGFSSRGEPGPSGDLGGGSFLDGLTMATNARLGGYGGFGGGGQSTGQGTGQAAGAGGYSGGGGARTTTLNHSGGGGGSFITPSATNVSTSTGLWEEIGRASCRERV
jgi:hypothetical protein